MPAAFVVNNRIPMTKFGASTGRTFNLPILHLAQLVGVAAGLEEAELKFKRHIVDPRPALERLEV